MAPQPPRYAADPAWADVVPFPQDDGSANALAAIAYTEDYAEAMAYLRAVMASEEHSKRVLDLTAHIIYMNPAHYTVWLYRARTIKTLKSDLRDELGWLNEVALRHIKNYQIWHHRQILLTLLHPKAENSSVELDGDLAVTLEEDSARTIAEEKAFLNEMFAKDTKNYHVWSYRQWLVRYFDLWESDEIQEAESWLRRDVRNNSAWNHRWFVVFGHGDSAILEEKIWIRELKFVQDSIRLAPQNESPWSYLRGLLQKFEKPLETVERFAREFANYSLNAEQNSEAVTVRDDDGNSEYEDIENEEEVQSSYALDMLADICMQQKGREREVHFILDLLATKYDPIRANYWKWRAKQLSNLEMAA